MAVRSPSHKVGGRRSLQRSDVVRFRDLDQARRLDAVNALAAEAQDSRHLLIGSAEASRFVAAEVRGHHRRAVGQTANRSVVGIMNEFSYLAEVDRAHGRSEDSRVDGRPVRRHALSLLYKRHSFPDRELAALVATHLAE